MSSFKDKPRTPAATELLWSEWLQELRSANGFEREQAVRAMHQRGQPESIPQLLERANDWVPQVRRAARLALADMLRDEHIAHWGRALTSVDALRRGGRDDHSELLLQIDAYLARPANLAHLSAQQGRLSGVASRMVFALRLSHVQARVQGDVQGDAQGDEALGALLSEGLASGDLVLASTALACVRQLMLPAQRVRVLGVAASSKHIGIRLGALRQAQREAAPDTRSLVRQLCFDASPAVRELALQAAGDQHAALIQASRERLAAPHARPQDQAAALQLLSALKEPDAAALCEQMALHHEPRVRRSALAVLFRLSEGPGRAALVLRALADASPKVQRLAVLQVHAGVPAPSAQELLVLLSRGAAQRAVLQVLRRAAPWERLGLLMHLLSDRTADDAHRRALEMHLATWCSDMASCFVAPTPSQREALRAWWQREGATVPAALQAPLRYQLASFGVL